MTESIHFDEYVYHLKLIVISIHFIEIAEADHLISAHFKNLNATLIIAISQRMATWHVYDFFFGINV